MPGARTHHRGSRRQVELVLREGRDAEAHLRQTVTFRPRGLAGRGYWSLVTPLYALAFGGLHRGLADRRRRTR